MFFREVKGDDLRIGGIRHGLPYAEYQAQREQRPECVHDPRPGGCGGPKKESSREDPVYIQPIYEPSGHDLETRIGPEECRKQNAQLRCRDAKLILQHRSCDSEIATIYIVDEDGDSQQQENNRQSGCESFTLQ